MPVEGPYKAETLSLLIRKALETYLGRQSKTYFYVGIGDRRPPGQDRRPDFGRRTGRCPGGRPDGPRGVRSSGHDRHLHRGRRNHHEDLRGRAAHRAQHHRVRRLQRRHLRLRLQHLRRAQPDPVAIARYFDGRGHGRGGRPGTDVRLCLRRDGRAHAAADHDGAQAVPATERRAAERRAELPAARRQEPGFAWSTWTTSRSASKRW